MSTSSGLANIAPAPDSGLPHQPRDQDTFQIPQRKNISTACAACRRRRSRCNGSQPCNACIAHHTDCVKDDKDDKRRKVANNKRVEVLELDQSLLDDLLATIRAADPAQLNNLVNLIRSHVSKDELRSHILQTSTQSARHRSITGRVQDMMNPTIAVPAEPWTTVTDDDDYVSHLISLWFTWTYQWSQWLDKDTFIDAMRARDPTSLICTPYMVNMILANACLLDTIIPGSNHSSPWLRDQFYNEAKRGIDAEKGQVSYALVASLGLQWTLLNTTGQDKLGNPVLYQQVYLADDLEKWRSRIQDDPSMKDDKLVALDLNLDRLTWTIFALNSMSMMNLQHMRQLKPPSRSKPFVDHHGPQAGKPWTPYPALRQPSNFHSDCHFHAFLSLTTKMTKDEDALIGDARANPPSFQFEQIYQQLEAWEQSLPDCIRQYDRAVPHTIALHAMHRWIMLVISKQVAASDAGQLTKPVLSQTPDSFRGQYWQDRCIQIAIDISNILGTLRRTWGTDQFPMVVVWPLSMAPFALLEGLEQRPDSQAALVELCIGACAASRRFQALEGMFATLQKTASERGITLPEECRLMIDAVTRINRKDQQPGGPKTAPSQGLDWLLDKWDDLDLD